MNRIRMLVMRMMTAVILAGVFILLPGCGKASGLDAEKYVKLTLDLTYQGAAKEYARFVGISKTEAEAEYDRIMQEELEALTNGFTPDAEQKQRFIKAIRDINMLADYQTAGAKETDGGFKVTLTVRPATVYQIIAKRIEAPIREKGIEDEQEYLNILIQAMELAVLDNEYGGEVSCEIRVESAGQQQYGINSEDMQRLTGVLFQGFNGESD